MAAARTVFIDTTLPNYAALVAHYDADVFNIVLLSNESPRVEQIQTWLTNNGASPADINIVSSINGVNGVVTPRVVFVDPGIADLDTVIAGMPGNATVVVLDASRDGVQQIHDYLSANAGMVSAIDIVTDIASVDVVSHGSPGEIKLGSTVLNMDSLAGYGSQLAAIGSHLSATADLLLYGCDVASGAIGEQFIAALAAATGVDVAASNDLTGSAAAGGDWVLEANTGTIETAALNIANYAGLLDTATSIAALKLSDDTGSSSSDFVTNAVEQTITGSFTASGNGNGMPAIWVSTGGPTASRTLATISKYDADPTKTGNGDTVGGTFSVTVKLVPGAGSIQFWTASSGMGSQIANSAKAYTLDTTPGSSVATLALSRDSGASASDFITDTAAQTISGTLSANTLAGEVVRISVDNGATWQTAANTVGQKTFSLSGVNLPGSGTIKVQVENAAGNAGTPFSQAFVVDTVAPAPGVLGLSELVDSGTAGDGITSDSSFSLALTGNEAGSSVIYETSFQQGVFVPTTMSHTTLADGSYLFRARVTDLAGNTSTTNTVAVTIDTLAPGAPVITGFADNSGSGSDTTTTDPTPTLTMSAEANVKVEVYRNGVSVGMASQTASNSGTYTFASAALPDGSYTFTAMAIDAAGNTSPVSLSQSVTIDTTLTAPTAALVTDSGTPGDGLTNTAALAFNNPDQDAKRVIKVDGTEVGSYDPGAL
ncbi:DUF4347 domain-containing protein, partial [Massilia sp. LjRoot122]|uniref:DUF4347 domain-containing protein n=1 Tax=Massilia sp. LjRoot122 TaxID=3342257 RepID=UPI003F4FCE10